jgi:cobalt-precorrin 5A hydrolase / precorrin-3B C17-methyltransferase
MKPVIFVLGPSAYELAKNLRLLLDGEIHAPDFLDKGDVFYKRAASHLVSLFKDGRCIVALCATGILVRTLGHQLSDKNTEPPVIAVSEDGKSVVPLLGGHHGANDIARKIAQHLNAHAAITTASDVRLGVSIDEPPRGYKVGNVDAVKPTAARLLAGENIVMQGQAEWLSAFASDQGTIPVAVTHYRPEFGVLTFHPQSLVVGVGCERGTSPEEVIDLVRTTLETNNIAVESVAHVATIDLKEDEPAITALGEVRYFTTKELNAESGRLMRPSEVVRAEVGTPSVAEAAALAAAGPEGKLIVAKTKSKRATCAIAQSPVPLIEKRGRSRGSVSVIGLGPGAPSSRTPLATQRLREADDWVGYDLYLDLAMDCYDGQMLYKFPLGAEEQRVRHALDLAKQGRRVALICSGDAGIYAMGALVYEVVALEPSRTAIEVVPGVSAFQEAAAKSGALMGHDFCCISLSDLLTPWTVIEKRIKAAADGDFVVSFYNPRSQKRHDQISKAMDILRKKRPGETPVVVASNLGRRNELIRVRTIDSFSEDEVDMLTLVIVGSSQSRMFKRGDQMSYAFTPRGYEKKRKAS